MHAFLLIFYAISLPFEEREKNETFPATPTILLLTVVNANGKSENAKKRESTTRTTPTPRESVNIPELPVAFRVYSIS